jgi:hypothetical protein
MHAFTFVHVYVCMYVLYIYIYNSLNTLLNSVTHFARDLVAMIEGTRDERLTAQLQQVKTIHGIDTDTIQESLIDVESITPVKSRSEKRKNAEYEHHGPHMRR